MLANVYKSEKGYVARYEQDLEHSAHHAWTWYGAYSEGSGRLARLVWMSCRL